MLCIACPRNVRPARRAAPSCSRSPSSSGARDCLWNVPPCVVHGRAQHGLARSSARPVCTVPVSRLYSACRCVPGLSGLRPAHAGRMLGMDRYELCAAIRRGGTPAVVLALLCGRSAVPETSVRAVLRRTARVDGARCLAWLCDACDMPMKTYAAAVLAQVGAVRCLRWFVQRRCSRAGDVDGAAIVADARIGASLGGRVRVLRWALDRPVTTSSMRGREVTQLLVRRQASALHPNFPAHAAGAAPHAAQRFAVVALSVTEWASAYSAAAAVGRLRVLRWLWRHAPSIAAVCNACVDAARGGQLRALRWLFRFRYSIGNVYPATCAAARYGGHTRVIRWLETRGVSILVSRHRTAAVADGSRTGR